MKISHNRGISYDENAIEKSGSGRTSVTDVPFCGCCGARLPAGCAFCLVCGTKPGDTAMPVPAAPPPDEDFFPPADTVTRKGNGALVAIALGFCALLLLSATGIWLYQALPYLTASAGKRAQGALLFVSGNSLFMSTSLLQTEEIESNMQTVPDGANGDLAAISDDGRYIAYLIGYSAAGEKAAGRLVLADLGKAPPPGAARAPGVVVEESCTETFFFAAGKLVYLTTAGNLCVYDLKAKIVADTQVASVADHNDSGVLYFKGGGADVSAHLIRFASGGGLDKRTVADGIQELFDWDDTFTRFIYTKDSGNGTLLFLFDLKNNSLLQMADSVDAVVAADAASGEALVQKTQPNALRLDDLINDDLFAQDAAIREPHAGDYPLLMDYMDEHGEQPDAVSRGNNEELLEENDRFLADAEAYEAKQARDKLRGQIRGEFGDFTARFPEVYDLYYCGDGMITRISERSLRPFDSAELASELSHVIWSEMHMRSFPKIRISAYAETVNMPLNSWLDEQMTETLYVRRSASSALRMFVGEGSHFVTGWQTDAKGTGLFFAMGDGSPLTEHSANSANLYWSPLDSGSSIGVTLVDEQIGGIADMLPDGRLLYYKDQTGGLCDLYVYNGGQHERVGDDVNMQEPYFQKKNGGKTLLFCEHFADGAGDLQMLSRQSRLVASNVSRFYYRSDSLVYMMRAVSGNTGELWVFGNNGLQKIADNVTAVVE